MKYAVFVSRDKDQFAPLEQMLSSNDVETKWSGTGKAALDLLSNMASNKRIDLIVLSSCLDDMAPRPLVEAIIAQSPFSHCVVAGDMEEKAFHDLYEGYGVLMQVSETPGPEDVEKLSTRLSKLKELGGL